MPELTLRRVVWALTGLTLAASVFLFGWSPSAVARRERDAARSSPSVQGAASPLYATRALRVRTDEVERAEASGVVRVSGLLAPSRHVTLSAEEEGSIASVEVEEHSRVEAHAVLVQLDEGPQ